MQVAPVQLQPAVRLRGNVEPYGNTDLNVLVAGLLASIEAPVSLRCDPLPAASGADEEWWMLLQWLLHPLRSAATGTRYVHVQCSADDSSQGEERYQLCVRCNSLDVSTSTFTNPQLATLARKLRVQLLPTSPADSHCLFILQFAGKKI